MYFQVLDSYLSSYISWSGITFKLSETSDFIRQYQVELVENIHQEYLGGLNRQMIETYIVWLKRDLKLADITKLSRDSLCDLLSNNTTLSHDITKHFNPGQYTYSLDNKQSDKDQAPSHVIFLKKIINTLTKSELAFREIEELSVNHEISDQQLFSTALLKLPHLIDDLFELVTLIDQCPNNLQPLLTPIQKQLIPALNQVIPAIKRVKNMSISTVNAAKTVTEGLRQNIPAEAISDVESRKLIIDEIFELPNVFEKLTKIMDDNAPTVARMDSNTLKQKTKLVHEHLESFLASTNPLSDYYHSLNCLKHLASISASLLNSSQPLTEAIYLNLSKELTNLQRSEIPKVVHDLALIEQNLYLESGILTRPCTEFFDDYYKLLSNYIDYLPQLDAQITDAKQVLETSKGRALRWIADDDTKIESVTNVLPVHSPLMQDQAFIQKRQSLLQQARLAPMKKLVDLEQTEQMATDFMKRFKTIWTETQLQRDGQILPIGLRLSLSNQYKHFQSYLLKTSPEMDPIIIGYLAVSDAERLKLIGECKLTLLQKITLSEQLESSTTQAINYINNLSLDENVTLALTLALSEPSCQSEQFRKGIASLPEALVDDYLPWCWFDPLTIQDVVKTPENIDETKTSSWSWSNISSMVTVPLTAFSMGLYGVKIISDTITTSSYDFNSIQNAGKSVLASIKQDITDQKDVCQRIDQQLQTVLTIKDESTKKNRQATTDLQLKFNEQLLTIKHDIEKKESALRQKTYTPQTVSLIQQGLAILHQEQLALSQQYEMEKKQLTHSAEQTLVLKALNKEHEPTQIPDNFNERPAEDKLNAIVLFSLKVKTLNTQKISFDSFFEALENVDNKQLPLDTLSEEDIDALTTLTFNFQRFLNTVSIEDNDFETFFVNAFANPSQVTIEELLDHQPQLTQLFNDQIEYATSQIAKMKRIYHQDRRDVIENTVLVKGGLTQEHESLSLFKVISELNLESKINSFRTKRMPELLQESLSPIVFNALDIENITYPIENYYDETQTQAIYKRLLNSLYYLEEGLTSVSNLKDISDAKNLYSKSLYLNTIISGLIVNVYNAYFYLSEDQQQPKIQKVINELLSILSPLESVPMLGIIITEAQNTAQAKQTLANGKRYPALSIKASWESEMRLLEAELGSINFRLSNTQEPLFAPQEAPVDPGIEEQPKISETKSYTETLFEAFYNLEQALNKSSANRKTEDLKQEAKIKTKQALTMFDSLSLDPESLKEIINELSLSICDIANVSHYKKDLLLDHLFEIKQKSLSKLYRITDNAEVSLGLKPGILTQNLTEKFDSWLENILSTLNINLDVSNIAHSQVLLASYTKRIQNQGSKLRHLSKDTVSQCMSAEIFGTEEDNKYSPYCALEELQGADFSNSKEGDVNRSAFFQAYEALQPHLSLIDYKFDRKFYLRELQSSDCFNQACIDIVSRKPQLDKLVLGALKDITQQERLCKEKIIYLKTKQQKCMSQLLSLAFKNKEDIDGIALSTAKKHGKNASTSFLSNYNQAYLDKYHALFSVAIDNDKTYEGNFLNVMHDIELERLNALEIHRFGGEMLDVLTALEAMIQKQINERVSNNKPLPNYLIKKIDTLKALKSSTKTALYESPNLTYEELKVKLSAVYIDFQKAEPALIKFSDNVFVEMMHRIVSWMGTFFSKTIGNKIADFLFVNQNDKQVISNVKDVTSAKSPAFHFFNECKKNTHIKESTEFSAIDNSMNNQSKPL